MRAEDRFYAGVIRYLFWSFRAARADFEAYLAAYPDGDRAVEARYDGLVTLDCDGQHEPSLIPMVAVTCR